jgi:ABC-2 type transport system ATP-binding protein
MLATLTRPDSGQARVLGHDLMSEGAAIRARISLTGQSASLDEDLTGRENLVLLARLLGHRRRQARARAEELLDAFGLIDAAARQVNKYSGGMRRRLDIAASIVTTPDLIFLDEPTTGLDPRSRNQVWQIVRALAAGGCTVLLTTQYLEEADRLADQIAVIDRGAVIAAGTSAEVKASVGTGVLRIRLAAPRQRAAAAQRLTRTLQTAPQLNADPSMLSIPAAVPALAAHALSDLSRAGIEFTDFILDQPSLDEAFLALTGHPTSSDHAS